MKESVTSCLANQNRIKILYATGILFLLFSAVFGILAGSTSLGINEIANTFAKGADYSPGTKIFTYVRFPRVLASLFCGAALSVSGAVIQNVLANKLASPGIIGVNSGAGLLVVICTAFGIYGGWEISLCAFSGAFLAVMTVSIASKKWGASRSTVILMGVALNSLFGAVSDSVITFLPDAGVMSNGFKVGEFSGVIWQTLIPAVIIISVALIIILTLVNELDVLSMGEESAKALGMKTAVMRVVFLLLSAVLSGCAVSLAGLLGFVGLIIPHMVRRFSGGKPSVLIPLCILFGGGFVCLCDTLSRTLFSPYEIPVGIIMAFLGAPFFVFILLKGKGGHKND